MKGETHKCPVCENQTATRKRDEWRCRCGAVGSFLKTNYRSSEYMAVRERPAQPKENR